MLWPRLLQSKLGLVVLVLVCDDGGKKGCVPTCGSRCVLLSTLTMLWPHFLQSKLGLVVLALVRDDGGDGGKKGASHVAGMVARC